MEARTKTITEPGSDRFVKFSQRILFLQSYSLEYASGTNISGNVTDY